MDRKSECTRLLIYSHDSFGLGHLRRCQTIAHSLIEHRKDLSVLILSGSPIIGSFDFRSRVDFVRIPGVIKLRDGNYTPLNLDIGIDEIINMRASIICHTAKVFEPDFFLVDKEPLGLRGEIRDTLNMLKARGTPLILGLRDIMDDPEKLADEWKQKQNIAAVDNLYDQIWAYGLRQIYDPLKGIPVSPAVKEKIQFTGYLRRAWSHSTPPMMSTSKVGKGPYLLTLTGGGNDGAMLIDWVLRAYEYDASIPHNAILVLGPFMHTSQQAEFMERVNRLNKVEAITFDANIEHLIANADGIVCMGGYNTFCEILSFDKPSIIVPRTIPRKEQYIRATRAQELGLARKLSSTGKRSSTTMAKALHQLPFQAKPSEVHVPELLDGLSVINSMVDTLLNKQQHHKARLSVVDQGLVG